MMTLKMTYTTIGSHLSLELLPLSCRTRTYGLKRGTGTGRDTIRIRLTGILLVLCHEEGPAAYTDLSEAAADNFVDESVLCVKIGAPFLHTFSVTVLSSEIIL